MYDRALGFLREARAELLCEREEGCDSRELSVTLTEIDSAILWRQEDLRLKTPAVDETQHMPEQNTEEDLYLKAVELAKTKGEGKYQIPQGATVTLIRTFPRRKCLVGYDGKEYITFVTLLRKVI